jgi:ubiquinone/menaquinone biosynthesis C-methylase UbiE
MDKETQPAAPSLDVDAAVKSRYSAASAAVEAQLCCPIDYDPRYLAAIPAEVLERDYGCGDPSRYVREGDTVLDLGSGGGKICYIASQIVGATGRVIGVDMTDDMLALARQHQGAVSERIGWDNVTFHKGRIQDLRVDVDQLDQRLAEHPVRSANDLAELEGWKRRFESEPMVADNSVDVVVSNCVLNLVDPADRSALFGEIFRVLKKGGRAAISDIVADEPVPEHMLRDPELWSGCISGAMTETGFLAAFEAAGFHGIELVSYQDEPWQTLEGIEFRSVTVQAWKGKQGACWDCHQAVIYRGPYKSVLDDDGHVYPRGQRVAVCEKTWRLLRDGPYADSFCFVEPLSPVPLGDAEPFPCAPPPATDGASAQAPLLRTPTETKGEGYSLSSEPCVADSGCC